jgi:hypothetical protein
VVESLRSLVMDLAFSGVDGMALGAGDGQAGDRYCLASSGIPDLLDLEDPARSARTPSGPTRGSRPDPPHEQRECRLGSTADSR